MRKFLKKTALAIIGFTLAITATAYAYNYKFQFDMNTGLWHGAAYSSVAYKVTKSESPVLKVDNVESKVSMNFVVVNSNDVNKTGVITTKSAGNWVFTNDSTAQNYEYRLKAYTTDGHWYNTYNVTGAWNPDSY